MPIKQKTHILFDTGDVVNDNANPFAIKANGGSGSMRKKAVDFFGDGDVNGVDHEQANGLVNGDHHGANEQPEVNGIRETKKKGLKLTKVRRRQGNREAAPMDPAEKREAQKKRLALKQKLLVGRQKLPMWSAKEALKEKLNSSKCIVLVGETGSGKSTQLPQFLLECDFAQEGCIAVTQPRRVAAVNLAKRVAQEYGTELGNKVGYTIRFDDTSGPYTRIKYMTDGMLLRELISDSDLSFYNTIVLDEAHERTLLTDMMMGFLKKIMKRRPTLRVVIMSATLDAERFSEFFDEAEICYVEGRQFPVEIQNTVAPEKDYVDAALRTIFQIHTKEPLGDVLAFFTGQDEIEALEQLINEYAKQLPSNIPQVLICPLFSGLPQAQQQKVFVPTPPGTRKIILATNIAETSVTVSGVRYVVDCGLSKVKQFNNKLGLESLLIQPISKSAARQRAGRAGREAPGTCYRLYTEEEFSKMRNAAIPEIKRCDLATAVLTLKARGENDVLGFDYMDPPSRPALIRALENLYSLGALDNKGNITKLGEEMSLLPLVPPLARVMIAAARQYDVLSEVVDIVACLQAENLFVSPADKREEAAEAHKKFAAREGDHLTLLECLKQFLALSNGKAERKGWCETNYINARAMSNILNVRKQLRQYCERAQLSLAPSTDSRDAGETKDAILKSFLAGYMHNTALLHPDGSYRTVGTHQPVAIHPSSVLFGKRVEAIVYAENVFTQKAYVRGVSKVEGGWLTATTTPK
ncbi:hypothetical protein G7K_3864-t1 [Saitoella complicata NRRL Y-17804]|uniref:RNA helicase n=2 Tax=Saitoella complicata (strain BCRC 22490 / CBS 7301 / JCM 7358 / NBRC 10748 / NRRL Y-17804) TaxID=698492 RepID=A0A0E9NJ44_SAICN|nr:hypothetical protein G7K_3864-t1 [Saitoella complicata NRRL Y-17804]